MLAIQKHKRAALYSAIFGLGLLLQPLQAFATIDADRASAVIFVYQRVGDESLPQGSISLDQFRQHIRELKTGGYNVLPLPRIIEALKEGDTLPQKTVGITFEGAYANTINAVRPLLDEANLPFTVFFSSDLADGGNPAHMTWGQLKDLRRSRNATLGILPSAYAHMVGQTKEQNAALINKAIAKYRENFDEEPQYFAYPYGEYSAELRKQMESYAFSAAFGQQSGVVHAKSDFLALPRFTMTDNYGDLERFQITAGALPLPVTDLIPDDMIIKDNPPLIGFTVTPDLRNISKLSCFVSGVGKSEVTRPGGNRVEIRLTAPLDDRRTRINCTMPDDTVIPGERQAWRWFGMMLIAADYDDEPPPSQPPGEEGDDESGND
jgi:poly-beta-1,6-N-acetyl-D-glucosamine N-deacetylase